MPASSPPQAATTCTGQVCNQSCLACPGLHARFLSAFTDRWSSAPQHWQWQCFSRAPAQLATDAWWPADAYSLFFIELLLFNFVELRRFQDYRKPGSMGKQYLLGLESGLKGSGDPAYPGASADLHSTDLCTASVCTLKSDRHCKRPPFVLWCALVACTSE